MAKMTWNNLLNGDNDPPRINRISDRRNPKSGGQSGGQSEAPQQPSPQEPIMLPEVIWPEDNFLDRARETPPWWRQQEEVNKYFGFEPNQEKPLTPADVFNAQFSSQKAIYDPNFKPLTMKEITKKFFEEGGDNAGVPKTSRGSSTGAVAAASALLASQMGLPQVEYTEKTIDENGNTVNAKKVMNKLVKISQKEF